jgi:FkbM family methyltransferase
MRSLRQRISLAIKELVFRHYTMPFSRSGLEPSIVRFLKPDSPIYLVDIGASTGEFTATVDEYCGVRRALLVEPQPKRVVDLKKRFEGSRFDVHGCALADKDGSIEMEILNWDYSSSILPVKPSAGGSNKIIDLRVREKVRVDVRTLDGILKTVAWSEPIDLLKIDVQGAELLVLNGASDCIKHTRLIWLEVSFRELYEGAAVFSEIYQFMDAHGFRMLALAEGFRGEGQELLQGDALFAARQS